ncbi:hypothetical protein FOA52_002625 [Chlamydomonas sp. UWO 241]|nr:hypothetical protein FOA52_002625 [Chlamydomonas sp. UWO 241]
MPPLARRDVRSLVRKLGANAHTSQQKEALAMIGGLSLSDDQDILAAIASAGAIPPLVQLLGASFSDEVPEAAAAAMSNLAEHADSTNLAQELERLLSLN